MLSHGNLAWTARSAARHRRAADRRRLAVVPAAVAHRRADVHDPHAGDRRRDGVLRRVDREGPRRTSRRRGRPRSSACRASGRSSTRCSPRKLGEATGAKKRLARRGRAACAREVNAHARSRRADAARCSTLQYRLADRLVISKIKAAIGFDRARDAVLGRRADRARRARVLREPRPADPRDLRPVRGLRADVVQPARPHADRHGRSAAARHRGQDRRRRRDPGARPERVPRLLQGARGDRRGAAATAGCAPATSARSTATAS